MVAGIAYGTGSDPSLPPVNLPTLGNAPAQTPSIPRIVINAPPPQSQSGAGGLGPFAPYAAPEQSVPAPVPAQSAHPNAPTSTLGPFAAYTSPQDEPPSAAIGGTEAALRGAAHGLTFGFEPAIAGAVSGVQSVLNGGDFSSAYNATRQQQLQAEQQAEQQHPYLYTGADIAANIPTMLIPGLGASKAGMMAAEALPRIGQAIGTGALAGGLFGAGEQTSQGGTPLDIAEGAGGGALAGAALGGVLGSGVEGASQLGSRVASIVRGNRDADLEAQRLVLGALKQDQKQVGKVASDQAAITAAHQAGTDVRLGDLGGGTTKALLRASTNLSPEARDIVGETVGPRFEQQAGRVGRFIKSHFGGIDSDVGQDAIRAEARRQNKPLYQAAYRAGEGGMWSPELERLTSSPAMHEAVQGALQRGGNRSVAEGMGAFNPHVTFENGILRVSKKGGIPAYPDVQFWDYVQRELRDSANVARRAGRNEEADAISSLHRQLLAELDRLNPAFARARGTAATFFKASDALEAGANFVNDTSISNAKAARVIAKMKPAERELFKRGFAAELASKIERIGDNRSVLNSIFLNNGSARQRVLMALGPDDAGRLEALLRIEGIVDRTRRALGNSTTMQQGADAGKFAGVLAGIEGLKGAVNPAYLVAIPLIWAARQSAKQIDERVFTKVAELLMSDDPAALSRGLNIAVQNPRVRTALRYASDLSARQLVNLLGPSGVGAAALTLGEHFTDAAKEAPKHHPDDYYDGYGQQIAPP